MILVGSKRVVNLQKILLHSSVATSFFQKWWRLTVTFITGVKVVNLRFFAVLVNTSFIYFTVTRMSYCASYRIEIPPKLQKKQYIC